MRRDRATRTAEGLLLCPRCGRGRIEVGDPQRQRVTCKMCSAAYPCTDGVIDLLPDASPHRSPAQVVMESEAVVRIYESRLWRRSLVTELALGISFEREQELIFHAANLERTDTVLDLACGPGIYTRPLARRCNGGTVVGLDLSLPMLRYASRRARAAGLSNLVLIHGTALQLPFPPNRFDAVNCCGALHLFPDVPCVLSQVHRVLKPGGRFTVAAVRRGSGVMGAVDAELRRTFVGVDSFVPAQLKAQLVDVGFGKVQCHHAERLWLIMSAQKRGK